MIENRLLVSDLVEGLMALADLALKDGARLESQRCMGEIRWVLNRGDRIPNFCSYWFNNSELLDEWVRNIRKYNARLRLYQRKGISVRPIALPFPYNR